MKQVIVYILTLLVFASTQPVLVHTIAFLTQKDHIVDNLCIERNDPQNMCQGTCYLSTQIKNTTPINALDFIQKKLIEFKQLYVQMGSESIDVVTLYASQAFQFTFHYQHDFISFLIKPPISIT